MPKTTDGLPFPVETDPVRAGASAIEALATALQLRGAGLRYEFGALTGAAGQRPLLPTDSAGRAQLTFAKAFNKPPFLLTAAGAISTKGWVITIEAVTATGATLLCIYTENANSPAVGAVPFYYIAIGQDLTI